MYLQSLSKSKISPTQIWERFPLYPSGRYILSPFFDTSDDRINLLRLPEAYKNKMINMAEELLQILKDDGETWRFDLMAFAKLIEALDICSQCYPLQKDRPAPASIPFLVTKTMEEIDLNTKIPFRQ